MALPVVYRRKVGRDLSGGYAWYEGQRPGLGEEFLAAVDASLDTIEHFPEIFARVHGLLPRRIQARRGTFSLTYGSRPETLAPASEDCGLHLRDGPRGGRDRGDRGRSGARHDLAHRPGRPRGGAPVSRPGLPQRHRELLPVERRLSRVL